MTHEEKETISDHISLMLFDMYRKAHSESTKRGIAASKARRTEAKSNSQKK